MRISLAAKCQLLFGLAVVLIIAAALFVPWQRMEQLTEQLNQRSARTLMDYAIDAHVTRYAATSRPFAPGIARTTSLPSHAHARHGSMPAPQLVLARAGQDQPALEPFERHALRRFADSQAEEFSQLYETTQGDENFRQAALEHSCMKCHLVEHNANVPATLPGASPPATLPAARPIAFVAVDIPSQIDPGQVLLNHVFILSAGLLAGVLAIIVFYLITTRLILQPVRVLQETAQKVSEGDLNIRSDIDTGDEFQQLSETFNTMLTNLKLSTDQLRAVNKSLDIKLGQLAETNVALFESNRLKNEFLANVSHELRTPLNSILGFAELLRDTSTAPAEAKSTRYLQNILSSGRSLLDLINDLLDLAKIEAGRMEIRSEPLSISDLFEGLVNVLKPLCEQKSLAIVPSVDAEVPIIRTDPLKVQQILYNLLSNAIKFSPPGERIDLMGDRDGDRGIRISVTDRGPGVTPDQHQLIFEKFRQVDASVTRTHSGTGLGLAISKELVTLLGGSIGIDSEPGKGSTFWIVLPMKNETQTVAASISHEP